MVAAYTSKALFTNADDIQAMVDYDLSIGQRIMRWIDSIRGAFGNRAAAERSFLHKAKLLYQKALSGGTALKNQTEYLPYINEIVRNAILLDSYGIDPLKPKSHNSLLMHSLYAVADIGNGPEIIKLYVEEMNDPNYTYTTKRSYQLHDIEKYQPTGMSSQKSAISISPVATGNIHTVADLFATVKWYDSNYNPNPCSMILNADGTPKVVYHGTNKLFTIFQSKTGA